MRKTARNVFYLAMAAAFVIILYLFFHMVSPGPVRAVSNGEKNISLSWMGDDVSSAEVQEALTEYQKEHPGVSVQMNYASDIGYWDQLYLAAASHELPDLMLLDYVHLKVFADRGQLMSFDPYIECNAFSLENLDPTMLEYGKVGGMQYGIPVGIKAPALLFNEAVTKQAGINMKDGMTLEEFRDVCRKIYRSTKYKTLLPEQQSLNFLNYLLRGERKSLFYGAGLGYASPEDTYPFFELYETAVKEGWAFERNTFEHMRKDEITGSPLIAGSGPSNMAWCGFYQSNDMVTGQRSAKAGVELGITSWPSNHFGRSIYAMPSGFYTISAYSEYANESVKLINSFSHEQTFLRKMTSGKGLSVEKTYARRQSWAETDSVKKEILYLKEVVLPEGGIVPEPFPQNREKLNEALIDLENEILSGSMSAREASERFAQEAEELLGQQRNQKSKGIKAMEEPSDES